MKGARVFEEGRAEARVGVAKEQWSDLNLQTQVAIFGVDGLRLHSQIGRLEHESLTRSGYPLHGEEEYL